MPATRRRSYETSSFRAAAVADTPNRHWGLILAAGCLAGWVVILGAAKLLIALI